MPALSEEAPVSETGGSMKGSFRFRYPRLPLSLLGVSLFLSGCDPSLVISSDEWTWLWALVPFGSLTLGGLPYVLHGRKSQLEQWDLRFSPEAPPALPLIFRMIVAGAVLTVLFAAYNFGQPMSPEQELWNAFAWLLGAVTGVALAIFLGLRIAEPVSRRG
jgi:hypothetical protein